MQMFLRLETPLNKSDLFLQFRGLGTSRSWPPRLIGAQPALFLQYAKSREASGLRHRLKSQIRILNRCPRAPWVRILKI